ncbi:boophilin-H2-like [Eupeodes corollae]|uniref:boophilin-H2-like n=1 Tax=Eupeodes corollae TaxID=290404 RepID=UPI00248FB498|nr:boophilin-H2-like [Eupeodes corollae]
MKLFVGILIAILGCLALNVSAEKPALCNLEPFADGVGPVKCDALMTKYSYDAKTDECKEFNYGGCGGNDNKFDLQEECERICKV